MTNPVKNIPPKLEIVHIKLSDIIPDPNQPRHYFNETDMQELIKSITLDGVLQPILVRPKDKDYMIVFGERRYRASLEIKKMNGNRNTIPATIRELSDEETLRIQIIENLQRKDIQPMEEAVAFKSILDNGQMDIDNIAALVAKSTKYVALRLKLNELIPEFQEMLSRNVLSLHNAHLLCKASTETQIEALRFRIKQFPTDWRENKYFVMKDFEAVISEAQKNLYSAPFEISAEYNGCIKCTECPFNTANTPLLFDEYKEPHCTKASCYETKKQISLEQKLEEAKVNQEAILIVESYGEPYDSAGKQKVAELRAQGFTVFNRNDYDLVEKPEPLPEFELWLQESFNYNPETDDLTEAKANYDEEIQSFNEEIEEYNKVVASGDFKEAVVVIGSNTGRTVLLQLKEKAKAKIEAHASSGSTSGEIKTLNEREIRQKELDLEKVFRESMTLLKQHNETNITDPQPYEWNALCLHLYIISNQETRKWFLTKIKVDPKHLHSYQNMEVWKGIEKNCTSEIMAQLIRKTVMDTLISATECNPTIYGKAKAMYSIACAAMPDEVKNLEIQQQHIREEREKKLAEKIKQLQKKK